MSANLTLELLGIRIHLFRGRFVVSISKDQVIVAFPTFIIDGKD